MRSPGKKLRASAQGFPEIKLGTGGITMKNSFKRFPFDRKHIFNGLKSLKFQFMNFSG
jgi:hypothetical protein